MGRPNIHVISALSKIFSKTIAQIDQKLFSCLEKRITVSSMCIKCAVEIFVVKWFWKFLNRKSKKQKKEENVKIFSNYAFEKHKGHWIARRARRSAEFRGTMRYCSPSVHEKKEQVKTKKENATKIIIKFNS